MTDSTPFWPYALAAVLFTVAFLALPLLASATVAYFRRRAAVARQRLTDPVPAAHRGRHVPRQLRADVTPRTIERQTRS